MTKLELEKLLEHVRRPMYKIEKDLGMPMNTLQRAMKGTKGFPKKWVGVLKDYVKTGEWISANLRESKKEVSIKSLQTSEGRKEFSNSGATEKELKEITTNATKKEEKTLTYFEKRQRGLI